MLVSAGVEYHAIVNPDNTRQPTTDATHDTSHLQGRTNDQVPGLEVEEDAMLYDDVGRRPAWWLSHYPTRVGGSGEARILPLDVAIRPSDPTRHMNFI